MMNLCEQCGCRSSATVYDAGSEEELCPACREWLIKTGSWPAPLRRVVQPSWAVYKKAA